MVLEPDLRAWLTLSFAPGLTNEAFRHLLAIFGGPEAILAASRAELARAVPERAVRAVTTPVPAELVAKAAEWLADPLNHVVTLADTAYPKALLDASDPPPILYAKG